MIQPIADTNPGRLSLLDARKAMLAAASPLPVEEVPLAVAFDRPLADSIRATEDLVPFARSAMDGYAVRSAETIDAARGSAVIPVSGVVYAGDLPAELRPRTAMEISTGAPLPLGADAVVPFEEVDVRYDWIALRRPVVSQAHVFPPGEDALCGDVLAHAGEVVTAGRAAMLASAGIQRVPVHRRPRLGIICTGDELVDVGAQPRLGQVRNSNATMLAFQATRDGADVVSVTQVRDRDLPLRAALRRAIANCDLVVTTGGASHGPRDLVKDMLASLGARFEFASIAMRPAKPTAFARIGRTLVAVLPGNPAAAFVAYASLVRGVVRRLGGWPDTAHRVQTILDGSLRAKAGRDVLAFGWLRHNGSHFVARPLANQCSSLVRTSAEANALIHVPPGETTFLRGSCLYAEVFDWETVSFERAAGLW